MIFQDRAKKYWWVEYPNQYGRTSQRKFRSLTAAEEFLFDTMKDEGVL